MFSSNVRKNELNTVKKMWVLNFGIFMRKQGQFKIYVDV